MSMTDARVSYIMIGVTDMARSRAFYEQTLGRKVMFAADGDAFVFIDGGPVMIGLNKGLSSRRPHIAGATEIVFAVDNVKQTFRDLSSKGVAFVAEPRQATDKDWVATFADPDGHYLTLFGPPGE